MGMYLLRRNKAVGMVILSLQNRSISRSSVMSHSYARRPEGAKVPQMSQRTAAEKEITGTDR